MIRIQKHCVCAVQLHLESFFCTCNVFRASYLQLFLLRMLTATERGEPRPSNMASRGGAPEKVLPIETLAMSLDELNRLTGNLGAEVPYRRGFLRAGVEQRSASGHWEVSNQRFARTGLQFCGPGHSTVFSCSVSESFTEMPYFLENEWRFIAAISGLQTQARELCGLDGILLGGE